MMNSGRRLNILKVIDVYGWSYNFVNKEYQKYSRHNIIIQKHDEIALDGSTLNGIDLIYSHSPNISPRLKNQIPQIAKEKSIKFIGGYGGQVNSLYSHADALVAICEQTYDFLQTQKKCDMIRSDMPIIFLTEFIDHEYFEFSHAYSKDRFVVGYAGSFYAVKRPALLNKLKYPVVKQSEWGNKFFSKDRTLDSMKAFYKSIDALVLVSTSECIPRVVMEAMACGVPVVSTNTGMCDHLLKDSNELMDCLTSVVPDSAVIDEMNISLDKLKEDIGLRSKVALANRRRIESKYNWKIASPILDDVFELLYESRYEEASRVSESFRKTLKE